VVGSWPGAYAFEEKAVEAVGMLMPLLGEEGGVTRLEVRREWWSGEQIVWGRSEWRAAGRVCSGLATRSRNSMQLQKVDIPRKRVEKAMHLRCRDWQEEVILAPDVQEVGIRCLGCAVSESDEGWIGAAHWWGAFWYTFDMSNLEFPASVGHLTDYLTGCRAVATVTLAKFGPERLGMHLKGAPSLQANRPQSLRLPARRGRIIGSLLPLVMKVSCNGPERNGMRVCGLPMVGLPRTYPIASQLQQLDQSRRLSRSESPGLGAGSRRVWDCLSAVIGAVAGAWRTARRSFRDVWNAPDRWLLLREGWSFGITSISSSLQSIWTYVTRIVICPVPGPLSGYPAVRTRPDHWLRICDPSLETG
jgi:hypothetical protein